MIEKIDTPVSVYLVYDDNESSVAPRALRWNGRTYKVKKIGFHHKFKKGHTLFHVFSVASDNLFFRLVLNTENLQWRLEKISDGLPS